MTTLYTIFVAPFEYNFMKNALLVILIAGVLAPVTGFWALNRRMVYMMDAMSHSILPGVILSAMFGVSYLYGGLLSALALGLIVIVLSQRNRAPEDGAIGVASQLLFATGVLLASQSTDSRSFNHILFGNPFSAKASDITLMLITALVAISLITVLRRELVASTFDHEHAQAIGVKVLRVDLLLILCIAATTVIGLSSVGVLMTISLGITPAVTMRILQVPFMKARYGAVMIGVFAGLSGILTSYHFGVPAGPAVALICAAILFISLIQKSLANSGLIKEPRKSLR